MSNTTETIIQCDFDGTVTEKDVSFMILDAFADSAWRQVHNKYQAGEITVGRFNSAVFNMVKADRESIMDATMEKVKIRDGFQDLVALCRSRIFRFVIVSNGLDFYIRAILKGLGLNDIEIHAARTDFHPNGLIVQYIGPDNNPIDDGVKEAFTDSFLGEGYRVVYIGDGTSDLPAARKCHHIFATGSLLSRCREEKLDCTPFTNFTEVINVMESW